MNSARVGYFEYALWLTFAVAALVVLAVPFPPMQDLPQHIFQVKAWTTFNDPAFNWQENYRLSFNPGPYNLPYMVIAFFSFVMPIMWAVRVFLSLCLLLYAWLIVLVRRTDAGLCSPWPLLLAFPLFFQHIYYLGMLAVLIGVPLSLIAGNDVKGLAERGEAATGRWGWFVLVALFFSHPFCIAAYLAIGGAFWLRELWGGKRRWTLLARPTAILIAYVLWHLLVFMPSIGGGNVLGGFSWEPRLMANAYPVGMILPFTGMKYHNGLDWPSTLCWLAVAVLSAFAFYRGDGGARRSFLLRLGISLACFALFFLLPYRVAQYSVFSLRALPYAYWYLLLALAALPLTERVGKIAAAVALVLLLPIYLKTASMSRNLEDAADLLKGLQPNRAILWQDFDGAVQEIDPPNFFVYNNTEYYYQILVGGGFNPFLSYNTMWPVTHSESVPQRFKDIRLFRVLSYDNTVGYRWSWMDYGDEQPWEQYFDYLLMLDAPPDILNFLNSSGKLPTISAGRFTLVARDTSLLSANR